jgi:hypothetical protein
MPTPVALQATGMKAETYRGVKIRTKVGKGQDWGYTHIEVNGHNLGPRMDNEERVLASTRATVDDAIERPDAYDDHWQPGHKGVRDPSAWQGHRCARRILAKEQITVPPEVDTMREEICPVCGSDDSYVGDKCSVCGFEKPPSIFMDPDTSLAQQVNLHQEDQEDANDDGAGELQCPNCGETFSSAEALNQAGDPHLAPAAQTIPAEQDLEVPEDAEQPEEGLEDEDENQMAPGAPEPQEGPQDGVEPDEDEDQEEELPPGQEEDQEDVEPPEGFEDPDAEPAPGESPEEGQEVPQGAEEEEWPEEAPDEADAAMQEESPEQAAEQQYAADQAGMAETGYEEGDICPNCGQGLLQPVGEGGPIMPAETSNPRAKPDSGEEGESPFPASLDADVEDEDRDEATDEGEDADEEDDEESAPPPFDEDADEDADADVEDDEGDEGEEEEGDDDEDTGPPWLKKKTVHMKNPPWEGVPSTMPNRPRNGRTTPRSAAQSPNATYNAGTQPQRSSVRTALHASLNAQAGVLRQMTAACQQERLLRLAAEARIETLERQLFRFAQLAGADADPELRHINEVGYRRHASLMSKAASLHTADQRNPADPVPEGAPEPPVVTEQEAAQPAARDDVSQLGATPVTDVSADATVAVDEPYGTMAFEPMNLNEVDVTAPVQNTQGHLPPEQTIIPVEVRVGDPDDPQPAYGWTIDGGNPSGQTGGSVGSGQPVGMAAGSPPGVMPGTRANRARPAPSDGQVSLGALRLARLRMEAGIAPPNQDDLSIAAAIQDNPALSAEAINAEIRTLTQVLSTQIQMPGRVATANRRLVPRSAPGSAEPPPSLAPTGEGPIRAHASTGAVSPDEMLFE